MLVLAIEQDRRKYMGHDRRVQRKARPSSTHEQKLEQEYTKVLVLQVEREVRERVIDSLHKEAMMWMDRFTFTLNGNQELP